MKRIFRIASFAIAAAALALAQGEGKHLGQLKQHGGMGFGLGDAQLERLAAYLDLTDTQLTQAKALYAAARAEEDKVQPKPREIRDQIEALIRKSTPEFDVGIQALVSAYSAAVTHELAIKARTANRFWNLLTLEQQQKLADLDKFFRVPPANQGGNGKGKGNGK